MNKKLWVIISFQILIFPSVFSKSDSTLIGQFKLPARALQGIKKHIFNDSKYHLAFRYTLKDPKTGQVFTQEPVIKRAEQATIDFHAAALNFNPDAMLDVSLSLLRVKQLAKGAGFPLVTSRLKDGALALQIHKMKFLNNNTFAFSMNKNRLLVVQASKA